MMLDDVCTASSGLCETKINVKLHFDIFITWQYILVFRVEEDSGSVKIIRKQGNEAKIYAL